MKFSRPLLQVGVLLLLLTLGLAFYFTPHLALYRLSKAANARDAAALAQRVDFPAVREKLSQALTQKLLKQRGAQAQPFDEIREKLIAAFIEPVVNKLLTPEGFVSIFNVMEAKRGTVNRPGSKPADGSPTQAASMPQERPLVRSGAYESFDRYVLTLADASTQAAALKLVMHRGGMFDWQLVEVQVQ